jgi:hypothetical protein
VKIFALRFLSGARQRGSLPCVFSIVHDKQKRSVKKCLPCVSWVAHGKLFFSHTVKSVSLYVCQRKTHGKDICLPCVLPQRTSKYFQKKCFFTSFNFSTSKTLFCTLYFNHMHVSINLLFLTIMCHLNNFCPICQI